MADEQLIKQLETAVKGIEEVNYDGDKPASLVTSARLLRLAD